MATSRPNTIPGLLLHLGRENRRPVSGCAALLALLVAMLACCVRCGGGELEIATFNIENFPKGERQIAGAFAILSEIGAPVIALQEITDPIAFEREARARLGDHYRAVWNSGGPEQRIGVLYDRDRFELAFSRTHDQTRLTPNGKPTLEVRLRRRGGARAIRVFVVHLKAGGDSADLRREQLRQLAPIVLAGVESFDDVIVLGDFNATGDEDRAALARFARETRTNWASEDLECTSYWNRRDGCRGTALDHVFSVRAPRDIAARGPCEEIGCSPEDGRCPIFHRDVSDHCPVSISF
jgi:endonuclease/exonuclease/phosphatase family metal-dependent hydrolase